MVRHWRPEGWTQASDYGPNGESYSEQRVDAMLEKLADACHKSTFFALRIDRTHDGTIDVTEHQEYLEY